MAYAWFWIGICWHMCSFFPMIFYKVFRIFLVLKICYYLKTYCYIFDLCFSLKETDFLLFTFILKEPFFSFSFKLFNKYFSLPQSTFQFRVLVRKWAKIVMCIYVIFIILIAHNNRFFWKGLSSNYLISYSSKTGLFEIKLFCLNINVI